MWGRRMGGTRQRKMDLRLEVIVSIFTVHDPNKRIGHQKMVVPLEIVLPLMLYIMCNHTSHPTFITALTLALKSLNDDGFSNVSTCGFMPNNSNCSLTDLSKYKRMARFIYIFTITKVSMNH
jgi:hypothetical protein